MRGIKNLQPKRRSISPLSRTLFKLLIFISSKDCTLSNVPEFHKSSIAMGGWNIGKGAVNHLLPGGGDFMSAVGAGDKASAISDILQTYFQARDESFNGKDIEPENLLQALLHARGKKTTKAQRKLVIGGAKAAITIAVAATGATVGSILPVAGTIAGGTAGYGAGLVLSTGVGGVDRLKRSAKGILKHVRGTRGKHREQAALSILYNSKKPSSPFDAKQAAAQEALVALLGSEAGLFFQERITEKAQIDRLAARLKSN